METNIKMDCFQTSSQKDCSYFHDYNALSKTFNETSMFYAVLFILESLPPFSTSILLSRNNASTVFGIKHGHTASVQNTVRIKDTLKHYTYCRLVIKNDPDIGVKHKLNI